LRDGATVYVATITISGPSENFGQQTLTSVSLSNSKSVFLADPMRPIKAAIAFLSSKCCANLNGQVAVLILQADRKPERPPASSALPD
jgi:hypothetical protein